MVTTVIYTLRENLTIVFSGSDIVATLQHNGKQVEIYRVPLKDIVISSSSDELSLSYDTCHEILTVLRDKLNQL